MYGYHCHAINEVQKGGGPAYRERYVGPYLSDPLPFGIYAMMMLILALLSGFFALLNNSLSRNSPVRSKDQNETIYENSKFLTKLYADTKRYQMTCQLGMFLPVLGLGWFSEPAIAFRLAPILEYAGLSALLAGWLSTVCAILVITLVYLVLGHVIPAALPYRFQELILQRTGGFLIVFSVLMTPLVWMLSRGMKSPQSKGGGQHSSNAKARVQSEEFIGLMKAGKNDGIIDPFEYTLLDNIFDFSKTTAREIMIPRTEMICLNTEWTVQENLKIASIQMRTRYPVCTGDKDQIIGFVHLKDLFMSGMEEYLTTIRPILTVPESTSIAVLLKQMKTARTQIAIVIDEYGGTSGLVTLEDIVEEILGEIQDEFDNERPLVEYMGASEYSIDGLILLEELKQMLSLELEETGYDTLGGWMLSMLESFPPRPGEFVIYGSHKYCIEEVDHHRISRIKLIKGFVKMEEPGA